MAAAHLPQGFMRLTGWNMAGGRLRHAAWAALALTALAVPRLITAAPLDVLADATRRNNVAERPGENFPGSAYFFADDIFQDVPSVAGNSEHVLKLDTVQAAPMTTFRGLTPLDSYRAVNCLTSAIYYEAGNEPEEGQRAVAQVVLNRVRSPLWPHSVCGVVYEGSERSDSRCQFTFSCDGSMGRASHMQSWARARRIAEQALAGRVYAPVGLATFYHTLAVRPGWAAAKRAVAVIGAHIFYSSPGFHGTEAAFRVPYAGREWQSGPSLRSWPTPIYRGHAPPSPVEIRDLPIPSGPEVEDSLPPSTIRPEYRNSGRPLI
ncbi:N-acetylmuramoyl-L-alanine amidase [Sphingobium sp. EP60837]|uniref:Cell wall hydrolase n=2 Tax=Sphingomonadaceae TaxID=41297 RepID=A0ABV9F6Z0_9SPHN|nr:N-acetylmuramoyl-L-alanine amidase [Sphingobium sp. EP60837]